MMFPKPTHRARAPRPLRRSTHRIRVRRPAGTVRREAKAAGGVDPDTWLAICVWYDYTCAYCPYPASQQDHVKPLSRGGKHVPSNVAPCCTYCQYRKGTQTWEPKRRHPWMEAA